MNFKDYYFNTLFNNSDKTFFNGSDTLFNQNDIDKVKKTNYNQFSDDKHTKHNNFNNIKLNENDYEPFYKFLLKHNVFNVFYNYSSDDDFKKNYKSVYLYNIINNQHLRDELWSLLNSYNRKVVLLKGISLFETIYKNNLNRHISDIDLLVYDYEDFKKFLLEKGFIQVSSYVETFRRKNLKIDVHTDLINKNRNIYQSRIIDFDLYSLVDKNITLVQKNVFRLNNEIEYLYLLSHLFIHHNLTYLKWITDIIIYNREMSFNKNKLISLLNNTKVNELLIFFEKIFYISLKFHLIENQTIPENYLYKVIGSNRYAIHFWFLNGYINKIKYFFFIIKYLLMHILKSFCVY